MSQRKTVRTGSTYRRVFQAGNRTVRVAAYEKREGQETGVTFGIGLANPDSFSKITFEIIPETWVEIDKAVRECLKINGCPIDQEEPRARPKRTRKKKEPEQANGAEPKMEQEPLTTEDAGIVPPEEKGQPARRKVGSVRPDIGFGQ